ncbi:MAG TPA: NADP-binding protein [Firmicutes bacterium]|nr:NADP-binding protein [Candidatus Fermentithermobacillaceae bacterium]
MQNAVKVLLWGLGAMGSGMASMLLDKKDVEIVAALARTPSKAGKDLGDIIGKGTTGVKVTTDPDEAFKSKPDIVLINTASFVKEVFPEIKTALEHDADVITIAEEMSFPWAASKELSDEIDRIAKERGKTVLGTGINPGFVLDTLVIALTGICRDVKHIHAKRVNNLAPFGPTVMRTQGVGTTPEEFKKGLKTGEIVGHVGFQQSARLIGRAVGWEIDEVVEEREPIITRVERKTKYAHVMPGDVAGCRHTARAYSGGREVIFLEHPQQICPEAEGIETGDYITIDGDPPVNLSIKPEIPGGIGTIAIAVNMIPLVLAAPPGLLTMADLPVPRAILGSFASGLFTRK